MAFLAFSLIRNRPVVQAVARERFNAIIDEAELPRAMLILCETFPGFDAWHYDMDRVKTGASIYLINVAMGLDDSSR
jgi:hypothetical protein